MFGGFAYNATSFMFRPTALFAPTYLIFMGLCFASSIYLTITDTCVNMMIATLTTEARKEHFARLLAPTLKRTWFVGVYYMVFFLFAFCFMGFIKLWVYGYDTANEAYQIGLSEEYGPLLLVGAVIATAL